jgi:hypothetical protein
VVGLTDLVWAELIDFLTSTPTPEAILAFQPSDPLEQRLIELLERNQQTILTAEERVELDEFLRMNHFINMLKIHARQKRANK